MEIQKIDISDLEIIEESTSNFMAGAGCGGICGGAACGGWCGGALCAGL